jgi:hypothetical protein
LPFAVFLTWTGQPRQAVDVGRSFSIQELNQVTQRIFGLIGVLWGGGMLISAYINGGPSGFSAYTTGHYMGLAFGGVMLVVGMFALLKGNEAKGKQ